VLCFFYTAFGGRVKLIWQWLTLHFGHLNLQLSRVMNRNRGFSLIELLIVVAIILVVAAIAVPNLLRSKMSANEASAVASLHSIYDAEVTYATTYPNVGFAGSLTDLGGAPAVCSSGTGASPAAACLLDQTLTNSGSVPKSGYLNTYGVSAASNGLNAGYTVKANPVSRGRTGQRSFFMDQSGVIRFDPAAPATAASAALP
jgi:prepilin-type N-terminal cleavage/methylation domain-containing protein